MMTNYLAKYAYFTNESDIYKAVSEHKQEHWRTMNNTDRDILDVIRRYSMKSGAAHLKHDTIAEAIDKAIPTVRRAIRKLVKLGIIDRVHYIRPVLNGLGANIYVIRPFDDLLNLEKTAKVQDNDIPVEDE
jgi:DNA-binding transcriptional ArsR family regulator